MRIYLTRWVQGFWPEPPKVNGLEVLRAAIGAGLGLMVTNLVSQAFLGTFNPWFIAPMGASAVLLFAVPSSPLAQPWSILGGNLLSALIGVACARWIPFPPAAAATAATLSIAGMFALRCLHPPGGAVALTAVLGGPAVAVEGYRFAWSPVALNSLLLLVMGVLFHNLTRHKYPHGTAPSHNRHLTADSPPEDRVGFKREDLDDAVRSLGEFVDVTGADLRGLLLAAERRVIQRHFSPMTCSDIMSRDVVTIGPDASLGEAWRLLIRHEVKAMPVVGENGQLIGIVSLHDFLVDNGESGQGQKGFPGRRRQGRVQDIMTAGVMSARPDQHVVDLAAAFTDGGMHHLPVTGRDGKLVGMVTQSDLVSALLRLRVEQAVV